MSVTKRHETWTWASYLEWEARQDLRYEFVDGDVYAMTGGTSFHDIISLNIGAELRERLRGSPCRAHGSNLKVKAGANGRYPDALVDCGPLLGDALVASEPTAIFEVLSRSTAWLDTGLKLRDYDATESIKTYALIDQSEPRILVYRRDASGRLLSVSVELIDRAKRGHRIFDGVTFHPFARRDGGGVRAPSDLGIPCAVQRLRPTRRTLRAGQRTSDCRRVSTTSP